MEFTIHALGEFNPPVSAEYDHLIVSTENEGSSSSVQLKVPANIKPYNMKECTVPCDRGNEFLLNGYTANQVYESRLSHVIKNFDSSPKNCVFFSYGPDCTEKQQLMFGTGGIFESMVLDLAHHINRVEVSVCAFMYFHDGTFKDMIDPENEVKSVAEKIGQQEKHTSTIKQISQVSEAEGLISTIRHNISKVNDQTSTSIYCPRSVMANICLQLNDSPDNQKFNIWIIELANSQRVELISCFPKLSQLFDATHKELTCFANIFSSVASRRLKIPYQKSKIGNMIRDTLSSSPVKVEAFLHLNRYRESMIGEDACSLLLFHKMKIGGISNARSRDPYADTFLIEWQNNRLEAELSVAAKVVPSFNSIKLKDGGSYMEQADKLVGKAMEDTIAKQEKEKQQLYDEASQRAQEYLSQKAGEWQKQLTELETEESIVVDELNQLPSLHKEKEVEIIERIDSIHDNISNAKQNIQSEMDRMNGMTSERARLSEYIKQFEEKLAEFFAQFEGDQETVALKRENKRKEWNEIVEQFQREKMRLSQEFISQNETLIAFCDIFEGDTEDSILLTMSPENELEMELNDALVELKTADCEALSQLIERCESRREEVDVGVYQLTNSIDEVEKEANEMSAKTEAHRESVQQNIARIIAEKEEDMQRLKKQCIDLVHKGTKLTKIPGKGKRKQYYYYLSSDRLCCCDIGDNGHVQKEKVSKSIPLKNITKLLLGQHTDRFKAYLQRLKYTSESPAKGFLGRFSTNGSTSPLTRKSPAPSTPTTRSVEEAKNEYYMSFSLILKKNKTLDLIAENRDIFDGWVVGLVETLSISAAYGEALNKASLTLLNNYEEFPDLLPEEVDLCSKIHVPPVTLQLIKKVIYDRKQIEKLTIYDVYYADSFLNLLQAEVIHQFAVNHNWYSRSS